MSECVPPEQPLGRPTVSLVPCTLVAPVSREYRTGTTMSFHSPWEPGVRRKEGESHGSVFRSHRRRNRRKLPGREDGRGDPGEPTTDLSPPEDVDDHWTDKRTDPHPNPSSSLTGYPSLKGQRERTDRTSEERRRRLGPPPTYGQDTPQPGRQRWTVPLVSVGDLPSLVGGRLGLISHTLHVEAPANDVG